MNYYKRHLGDYARKAGHLSPLEHGVYNLILDAYYDREQAPTRVEAIRYARARSADEVAAVDAVLSEFFTLTDGVYVQSRVEQEFVEAALQAEKNRRNGKAGGRPRKAARIPVATQQKPSGFPDESQTKGNPLIHESMNPEQEQKIRAGASSAKRGTRLRPDWEPSHDDIAFASQHGVNWTAEADKFRDYWIAKSGAAAAKLDWPATWRNWIRSARRAPITNGGRPNAAANFRGKVYEGTKYEDLPANLRPENVD